MELSVVIPIYNQKSYLRECLESIANQECNNYEVILVNDGSTDESEEICLEYVKKYNHFKYIYQKNTGLGGARNKGLKYSSGKYIFFLDADDAIQTGSLQKLFLFAEENNADIVYFDEVVCNENLTIQYVAKSYQGMDTKISKLEALEFSMHPSHIWVRLYKRELFNNIQFSNIWYEDMEIFPRLLMKTERLFYYKVPIYYYRQHKQGITSQIANKRNLEVITAWRSVYLQNNYSAEEKRAIEVCIKKSVLGFIFFRPKYAGAYASFYNEFFAEKTEGYLVKNYKKVINLKYMPLWQQADFYGQIEILHILMGLRDMYRYGGMLRFYRDGSVEFQKENIQKEHIIFYSGKGIALKEIKIQKDNPMMLEVISDCSECNLISLKNEIKKFDITEIILEKAMLYGIRIDGGRETND